jgi:hypothetical protein
VTTDAIDGPTPRVLSGFYGLIAARLHYVDGLSPSGSAEALGTYRLLAESATVERIADLPPASLYKIFGVVPGARIDFRGTPPGAVVSARARIQTNAGRVFEWSTQTVGDSEGRATLRLPYSTGKNGLIIAGPYSVADGAHRGTLELDDTDIRGKTMDIDLAR